MPVIDRLRGVAILVVVLYHTSALFIYPQGWGSPRPGLLGKLIAFAFLPWYFGRVGVNLFFVISGLCIHMRVARQQAVDPDAPFSYRTFFLRRFFRIYPTYWAVLAVGAVVAPIFSSVVPELRGAGIDSSSRDVLLHAVMLHSFWKETMMSIVRPLCSIATEEQFYLLYPLVFVALGRRLRITQIVGGLLLFTVVWRVAFALANPRPETFYSGPFLVWVFGGRLSRFLGARPRLVATVGLALVVAANLVSARLRARWLLQDPMASFGWFLVMAVLLLPSSASSRPLPLPQPLRRLGRHVAAFVEAMGRRSYSIYLVHEMALLTVFCLVRRFHLPPLAVGVPLSLALVWPATLPFYRFIELPSERRSKQVGRRAPAVPVPSVRGVVLPANPKAARDSAILSP